MPRTALGRGALWSAVLVVLVLGGLLLLHLLTGAEIVWGVAIPGLLLLTLVGFVVSSASLNRDHHRAARMRFDADQDPFEAERKRRGLS